MTQTDKFDAATAIERVLDAVLDDAASRVLRDQFQWLLKVWNTDDDRCYEDFDPTKPYGACYVPPQEDDLLGEDQ